MVVFQPFSICPRELPEILHVLYHRDRITERDYTPLIYILVAMERGKFDYLQLSTQDSYDLGRVNSGLLLCEDLHRPEPEILGVYDGWAVALRCTYSNCNLHWYVCQRCRDSRKHLYTKTQITNHKNGKQHKKTKKQKSPTSVIIVRKLSLKLSIIIFELIIIVFYILNYHLTYSWRASCRFFISNKTEA